MAAMPPARVRYCSFIVGGFSSLDHLDPRRLLADPAGAAAIAPPAAKPEVDEERSFSVRMIGSNDLRGAAR
jgi:hypothetical protein